MSRSRISVSLIALFAGLRPALRRKLGHSSKPQVKVIALNNPASVVILSASEGSHPLAPRSFAGAQDDIRVLIRLSSPDELMV